MKVSSNSEMVRAGVLFENFGDYRELILKENTHLNKNESKIKDINETIRLPKISRKSDLN